MIQFIKNKDRGKHFEELLFAYIFCCKYFLKIQTVGDGSVLFIIFKEM